VAQVYQWKDFYKPTFQKVFIPSKDSLLLYSGSYLLGEDTISLKVCGNNLCVFQNGEPAEGLKAIFSNGITFTIPEIPNATITMLLSDGKVGSFELVQNGQKYVAVKTK
jgi:hypothetical protein